MEPTTKSSSQRAKILTWLRMRGPQGVLNTELTGLCMRYGARIHELREAGHKIETRRVSESEFRFVLVEPSPLSGKPEWVKESEWGGKTSNMTNDQMKEWHDKQVRLWKKASLFAL